MTRSLKLFLKNEAAGGVFLLFMAGLAFAICNSSLGNAYDDFINFNVFGWTLHEIVNDGLMVFFFYVVGLEIKKEIFQGSLADPKKSSLAVTGAIGGMIAPALIYYFFNSHNDLHKMGWAIPMATDIAFALGVLTLLGKRIPTELKIFLLALAIVDDMGAVLIIAIFYTKELSLTYLFLALIPFLLIYLMNRYRPMYRIFYILLGVTSWYLVYKSGVHATIAGIALAFLTPFKLENKNHKTTPLSHWLYKLHPAVTFLVMPLFAFFNAGLSIQGISFTDLLHNDISLGTFLGLFLGKPLGIVTFCYLACALKISKLPDSINWFDMMGAGIVAGIGFTMSLFINDLSFAGTDMERYAKLGIFVGSSISAGLGFIVLRCLSNRKSQAAA